MLYDNISTNSVIEITKVTVNSFMALLIRWKIIYRRSSWKGLHRFRSTRCSSSKVATADAVLRTRLQTNTPSSGRIGRRKKIYYPNSRALSSPTQKTIAQSSSLPSSLCNLHYVLYISVIVVFNWSYHR